MAPLLSCFFVQRSTNMVYHAMKVGLKNRWLCTQKICVDGVSRMSNAILSRDLEQTQKRVIELSIRIGVLAVLLYWCFTIIQPFVMMVIGSGIVAIALYPIFNKVSSALGNRKTLTAVLFSLALIGVIVVPAVMLTESLVEGVKVIVDAVEADRIAVPEPPARVAELPLVGPRLHSYWQQIAENPPAVIHELKPQLTATGSWLLGSVGKLLFADL